MRVLIVDAFGADQLGKPLLDTATAVLERSGHDVHRVDLEASAFPMVMTTEERRRYDDIGNNVSCPQVMASIEEIQAAQAVVFGFHTTMHTIPAHLKGWLERAMLPGVAFVFNENNSVRPGLTSLRRVGTIATTPHGRRASVAAGNPARRTITRSFRANCGPRVRSTYVSIQNRDLSGGAARVERAFSRW